MYKTSWTYIWLPQRGTLHFHLPRKFPRNPTQGQEIHPETFPQHCTFPLISIRHHSAPDLPDPFIHLSPAHISCPIPLPCLLLQAALVTPHHHIFRTPLLLLHLVTLQKFPYSDFTAIPRILHVIEATRHLPWHTTHFRRLGLGYCLFDINYLIQFSCVKHIGIYLITSSRTQSDWCLHLQTNMHADLPHLPSACCNIC